MEETQTKTVPDHRKIRDRNGFAVMKRARYNAGYVSVGSWRLASLGPSSGKSGSLAASPTLQASGGRGLKGKKTIFPSCSAGMGISGELICSSHLLFLSLRGLI
jgi:hypothetical protein